MSDLVWYAAYGSNLSRARFEHYLSSGTPHGTTHAFPGCRDASPPAEDRPWELERELAFGGASTTWGGGVAFLEPDAVSDTKARLYLVKREQFEDVVAQENWLPCGAVTLPDLGSCQEILIDPKHVYGLVLTLGELEGRPLVTLTQHRGTKTAEPSAAYLRHISDGLRESHAMRVDDIVDYLEAKRGIRGSLSSDQIRAALEDPL